MRTALKTLELQANNATVELGTSQMSAVGIITWANLLLAITGSEK
jgi:hypothetical protein